MLLVFQMTFFPMITSFLQSVDVIKAKSASVAFYNQSCEDINGDKAFRTFCLGKWCQISSRLPA